MTFNNTWHIPDAYQAMVSEEGRQVAIEVYRTKTNKTMITIE